MRVEYHGRSKGQLGERKGGRTIINFKRLTRHVNQMQLCGSCLDPDLMNQLYIEILSWNKY